MPTMYKFGFILSILFFIFSPYKTNAAHFVVPDTVSVTNDPPIKESKRKNKLAFWSIIMSSSGFLFLMVPILSILSPFLLVGGIVTGIMALGQIKNNKQKGKGLAIASLIVGGVSIAVIITAVIFLLTIFG